MTKTLRSSLLLALLATTLCLLGCQKDEVAKDSAAAITADAKAGGTPAVVPSEAKGQMNAALNDPNTPPEVKAKIKAQMGGGGQ
ncbi:hypothetical protein [Armatimonas sp.]|uniref:hypothetical protein n=1 Tax=Armatimonas sp. TaxID=1872638 RepID=UPI003753429E